MTFSPSKKMLLLFSITLIIGGVGIIRFSENNAVLLPVLAFVLVMFTLSFRALFAILQRAHSFETMADGLVRKKYAAVLASADNESSALTEIAHRLSSDDRQIAHKTYRAAVLKEIFERISVSLDEQEAVQIIAESLNRIVAYNALSYITFGENGEVFFRCHLGAAANKAFAENAKKKMMDALATLTGAPIREEQMRSLCFGLAYDEDAREPVRSFFSVPVFVDKKLAGLITAASTKPHYYTEAAIGVLYAVAEEAGEVVSRIQRLFLEEKNKTNSMLASISEGLIMVNAKQEIMIINKKAREILGLTGKETVSMLDIVQALYGKLDFRSAAEQIIRSQKPQLLSELETHGGIYKIMGNPVHDGQGAVIGTTFVFSDITQEKEVDRMKTEFISITSHQLRTPLSSMKWFMEMLLNNDLGELPEKQRGVLLDVYNSNERIITLVNDLLDVSRIEAGKMQNQPTPTNIIEFIKSMLPEVEQNFVKRKQKFEFIRPDSFPRVSADPKLIWQVLQNLLTNASKYTPEEGKITLTLSLANENALLTIADNGYGIPEFQKNRIFEKFFRADNITKMEGTGLGLYISKELAEASGGKLRFESAEGRGTTFYFSLPLASAAHPKSVQTSEPVIQ